MSGYRKLKQSVYTLLAPAKKGDIPSLLVDLLLAAVVLLSAAAVILDLSGVTEVCGVKLLTFEYVTIAIFIAEYLLRLWICEFAYPECETKAAAMKEYVTSFDSFIDLLSIASVLFNQVPQQIALLRLVKLVKLARLVKLSEHVKTSDSLHAKLERMQRRTNEIIDKGTEGDKLSQAYDILSVVLVLLSVTFVIVGTFPIPESAHLFLCCFEVVIACFFALEYILRVWTAPMDEPDIRSDKARMHYIFSFMSVIDLLSIVPVFVVNLPTAPGVLKIFKLCKITRLIKVSRYLRAVANFGNAIKAKKKQMIFSVAAICVMIMIASVLMYSIENKEQPEVFTNGFSGIYYSVMVLAGADTDIEPVSMAGKILSTLMLLLGGCMFGVPVAIVSTGFEDMIAEQAGEETEETDVYELMKQYDALDADAQKKLRAYILAETPEKAAEAGEE